MVEIPFSFVLRLYNSFGDKDNTGLYQSARRIGSYFPFGYGAEVWAWHAENGTAQKRRCDNRLQWPEKYGADKALQVAKKELRRLLS